VPAEDSVEYWRELQEVHLPTALAALRLGRSLDKRDAAILSPKECQALLGALRGLGYRCPHCNAKPGEPCHTSRGWQSAQPHSARLRNIHG